MSTRRTGRGRYRPSSSAFLTLGQCTASQPFNSATVRRQLIRKPVMTAAIVSAIHWQALRLYAKGVPYVPYPKETT